MNDYRISRGLPSLGFLNPFLYSKGVAGLVDIVVCVSPFRARYIGPCVNKIRFDHRAGRIPVVALMASPQRLVGIR